MADFGPSPENDPFSPYPNPQISERVVAGLTVIEAEVRNIYEGRSPRSHLRIIGGPGTNVVGRALVYADTYSRSPDDETYSYARHEVGQNEFLGRLSGFVEQLVGEFTELRSRPAVGVMQTADEMRRFEAATYFDAVDGMRSVPLIFARLDFPFGNITVEFQERPHVPENEFRYLHGGVLQRDLEHPLFGFDATRSEIWTPFLASIHWARNLVSEEVLREVLRMASRVAA